MAIAGRVSRPRTDTTDIVINEQTIMNACTSACFIPSLSRIMSMTGIGIGIGADADVGGTGVGWDE